MICHWIDAEHVKSNKLPSTDHSDPRVLSMSNTEQKQIHRRVSTLFWVWFVYDCDVILMLLIIIFAAINQLRPRQNGRHFPDYIFKGIDLNENVWFSTEIPLKIAPGSSINNVAILVQIMAWRRWGDKQLSEPMWLVYWSIYQLKHKWFYMMLLVAWRLTVPRNRPQP